MSELVQARARVNYLRHLGGDKLKQAEAGFEQIARQVADLEGKVAAKGLAPSEYFALRTALRTARTTLKEATAKLAKVHDDIHLLFNAGNCFTAGTLLLTPDGEKSIEQFMAGDRILSKPEGNLHGPVEVKVVEETFVRQSPIVSQQVNGKTICTAQEHPFYVKNKGWTPTRNLSVNDELYSHDGQWVTVEAVTDLNEVATVYNLRVSDYHKYFVGSREWGFSV